MDRFAELEVFVQVAELGPLSKAADALGISMAGASRYLLALESRLGVRLMQRTARQMVMTEAGAAFYQRSKDVLSQMREAEALVTETAVNPAGLLRVTASLSFCLLHITPMLPAFAARHPQITVDVVAANRYYDIIDNGVDVAVRTRQVEAESNITIRRLAETRRILAASPEYIARHGMPTRPEQLVEHKVLNYVYAVNPTELSFRKGGETRMTKIKALLDANDGQILRVAALDGMGILVQPKYIIHDDVVAGRLVPVLDDWDLPRLTINVAFQTRQHMPAKVRLFIDALVERFRANDYERLWTA
jgi:DNA-binding transcriptional LysR family regulator